MGLVSARCCYYCSLPLWLIFIILRSPAAGMCAPAAAICHVGPVPCVATVMVVRTMRSSRVLCLLLHCIAAAPQWAQDLDDANYQVTHKQT